MRKLIHFVGIALLILASPILSDTSRAQSTAGTDEATIRALEEEERLAVLTQDFDGFERLWSEHFMVNAPSNQVAMDRNAVLDVFRQGLAHYATFDRRIEQILLDGDLTIVMGAETVQPIGKAPRAGETVERRYTNIWKKDGGSWHLLARHANNILPSPE